jgi:hypothetical protein
MGLSQNPERRRLCGTLRAIIERRHTLDELVDTQRFTSAQFSNDSWHFGLHAGDSTKNIASACPMEELSPSQEEVWL